MHTVGPVHSTDSQLQIDNIAFGSQVVESMHANLRIWRANCIFTEKNSCMSEPTQFKPVYSFTSVRQQKPHLWPDNSLSLAGFISPLAESSLCNGLLF